MLPFGLGLCWELFEWICHLDFGLGRRRGAWVRSWMSWIGGVSRKRKFLLNQQRGGKVCLPEKDYDKCLTKSLTQSRRNSSFIVNDITPAQTPTFLVTLNLNSAFFSQEVSQNSRSNPKDFLLAREIRLLKCTTQAGQRSMKERKKIVTRIENYDLCSALFNLYVT